MAAFAIQLRHPTMRVTTDLSVCPGDPVPPQIGNFRPDIIAREPPPSPNLVIAEAKTDGDVDNQHTRDQIDAFVQHIEAMPSGNGMFVLAVSGRVADGARSLLRFACRDRVSRRVQIKLFDGLDFWTLGPVGATSWRLS